MRFFLFFFVFIVYVYFKCVYSQSHIFDLKYVCVCARTSVCVYVCEDGCVLCGCVCFTSLSTRRTVAACCMRRNSARVLLSLVHRAADTIPKFAKQSQYRKTGSTSPVSILIMLSVKRVPNYCHVKAFDRRIEPGPPWPSG